MRLGAGIYLRHVWGTLVPGYLQGPARKPYGVCLDLGLLARKTQDAGAWIEFQNYGRSEMDLAPLRGASGTTQVSRVWVNDRETAAAGLDRDAYRTKSNEVRAGERELCRQGTAQACPSAERDGTRFS